MVWRWDCDFLSPANYDAEQARATANTEMHKIAESISWRPENAVLIDNWCCAHGRADQIAAAKPDIDRFLLRYEFWDDAGMVI